ncbi:TetR family transcriptional regulator [Haloechinothrix salitolerans]|uniref:TetR family transcriptional regulator n=1 Tax=Haloechinothrix salitolerans TaxID=926830 RepID=A0ABW2C388_9PSEU
MAKAGRRPGQTETREQILAAARGLFAENGFDATTIRAIAAEAGVNAALIHHFFGSKDQVFVAALALPVNPADVIRQAVAGPREQVGERLTRFFLSVWGDDEARQPFLALLRSIASNENAARMMREFLLRTVVRPIAAEFGIGELAMTATSAHLVGIAMLRYVVRVEPIASASDDDVIATVAPVIQHYFD